MERLTRRIIWTLLTVFIVAGIAVVIWEAIPGIIKIIAIIAIVFSFFKIVKT